MTSYRLARELLVWRGRVMPRLVKRLDKAAGVLLVDRTLISRTMVLRRLNTPDIANNLYPDTARRKGRRITPDMVCPDVIFNLCVPKDILLNRLKTSDPKYAFRKKLIEETSDWFIDAVDYIPAYLRSRVVMVDNTAPLEMVFQQMVRWIESNLNAPME
jgi:thymidylate kinase